MVRLVRLDHLALLGLLGRVTWTSCPTGGLALLALLALLDLGFTGLTGLTAPAAYWLTGAYCLAWPAWAYWSHWLQALHTPHISTSLGLADWLLGCLVGGHSPRLTRLFCYPTRARTEWARGLLVPMGPMGPEPLARTKGQSPPTSGPTDRPDRVHVGSRLYGYHYSRGSESQWAHGRQRRCCHGTSATVASRPPARRGSRAAAAP